APTPCRCGRRTPGSPWRRRPGRRREGADRRFGTRARTTGTGAFSRPRDLDGDVSAGDHCLARESYLVDEVDVAEVLLLGRVEGRHELLAGDDLHAAESAGRLGVAGGGDGDAGRAGDVEHRVAVVARDLQAEREVGDRCQTEVTLARGAAGHARRTV